jgi:transcriptional regulator with XRE-family HTH domain
VENNLWPRLGKLVYNRRKFRGWSQRELAEKTWPEMNSTIMRMRIARLETGKSRMFIDDLLRLCVILKITEEDLLAPILDPRLEIFYPDPEVFERYPYLKNACQMLAINLELNKETLMLMAEEELRKTIYQLKEERKNQ